MSLTATRWAWSHRLGRATTKLVLLALADRADAQGAAYPGIKLLAEDTELDRKTVMAALTHLEAIGLIASEKTWGKASSYRLNLDVEFVDATDEPQPVPKTGPVPKTAPVPEMGPDQYQKRDRTSTKNGTRTYQLTDQLTNTPPLPPSQGPAMVADATGVGDAAMTKRAEKTPEARPSSPAEGQPPDGEASAAGTAPASDTAPTRPNGTPPGFDAFWERYPRKQARKAAIAAWNRAKPSPEIQAAILTDIGKRLAHDDQWRRGFIPHPATYLNGARWEDAIRAPGGGPHASHRETSTERFHRLNDAPLAELLASTRSTPGERGVTGEVVSGATSGVRAAVVVAIGDARGHPGAQGRMVGTGA